MEGVSRIPSFSINTLFPLLLISLLHTTSSQPTSSSRSLRSSRPPSHAELLALYDALFGDEGSQKRFAEGAGLPGLAAVEDGALRALYYVLEGAGWERNRGWMRGDACTQRWYGVTCDTGVSSLSQRQALTQEKQQRSTGNGERLAADEPELRMHSVVGLALHQNRLKGSIPSLRSAVGIWQGPFLHSLVC